MVRSVSPPRQRQRPKRKSLPHMYKDHNKVKKISIPQVALTSVRSIRSTVVDMHAMTGKQFDEMRLFLQRGWGNRLQWKTRQEMDADKWQSFRDEVLKEFPALECTVEAWPMRFYWDAYVLKHRQNLASGLVKQPPVTATVTTRDTQDEQDSYDNGSDEDNYINDSEEEEKCYGYLGQFKGIPYRRASERSTQRPWNDLKALPGWGKSEGDDLSVNARLSLKRPMDWQGEKLGDRSQTQKKARISNIQHVCRCSCHNFRPKSPTPVPAEASPRS